MTSEPLQFSAAAKQQIADLVGHYRERRAALIPALYVAQEEFGWLPREAMQLVAAELSLPESWVFSTATFYTMLRKSPVGKWHLQICTNVACYLRGSDALMKVARETLGIEPGQTTADGRFTLEAVECLAACGMAPALQVNKKDHFDVTPEKLRELLVSLRNEVAAGANGGEDA